MLIVFSVTRIGITGSLTWNIIFWCNLNDSWNWFGAISIGKLKVDEKISEHKFCVICKKVFEANEKSSTVKDGYDNLLDYSEKYGKTELVNYLKSKPEEILVHSECRKVLTCKVRYEQYCRKRVREKAIGELDTASKRLRSASAPFDWKKQCYLCGESGNSEFSRAETQQLLGNTKQWCTDRSDAWGQEVLDRLLMCTDLIQVEARYHPMCLIYFSGNRPKPSTRLASARPGRPVDQLKLDAFIKVCEWLETSDNDFFTLAELKEKAELIIGEGQETYSNTWLKQKLEERYGNHLFFAEVNGRKNVLCFRQMASYIINEKWYEQKMNTFTDECERIVSSAAKLVKSQIREAKYSLDNYPTATDVSDRQSASDWVPPLLQLFLTCLIPTELKRLSLGHALVQAARPKSALSPILFGLGVSLDHEFGSRYLLNLMSRLGFAVSYDEVVRFKQCVSRNDTDSKPDAFPAAFTQFAADNVDHQINTLDGLNTFHGMGVISMSVKCTNQEAPLTGKFPVTPVTRLPRCKVADIACTNVIPLLGCHSSYKTGLSELHFKPHAELTHLLGRSLVTSLDLIWEAGWFVSNEASPRPSWSAFMHDATSLPDNTATEADIRMLPIIDRNPNDMTTIYSTLVFIEKHSKSLNVMTPCVTFDQPLWLKAVDIIQSHKMKIVCRLGPFHTLMSFLGSIGSVMSGSGLIELLETCYGPNSITHMMTGKAVSRSLRGHFMVQTALMIVLIKTLLGSETSEMDDESMKLSEADLATLRQVYNKIVEHEMADLNEVDACEGLNVLRQIIEKAKAQVSEGSRTAKLWVQYINYVDLVKAFIRAERTGNWELHLTCVAKMLNLFSATGHHNYAKSARLYLDLMLELPQSEHGKWLHDLFARNGHHVVRRSPRFWTGLSTDLAIEQVMMKSLKSRGGLTHGRGMTESTRATWVNTLHQCASMHSAMNDLCDLDRVPEGHVETGKSRIVRDNTDIKKLISWLELRNPFNIGTPRLRSLSSGIAASDTDIITCDDAEAVGERIVKKMDGLTYDEVRIKKADRIKTLTQVSHTTAVGGKKLNIDSTLLFSRLLIIMQRSQDMAPFFKYELTAMPAALFKDSFMRKTDKAQLKGAIIQDVNTTYVALPDVTHVIDGGFLLHRVKWNHPATYDEVANQYVDCVRKLYGTRVIVVFDGYGNGPSTKDHEHLRRAGKYSPDIVLDGNSPTFKDQGAFLCNDNNKKCLISLLNFHMQANGIQVHQAKDDADTLIVKTALTISECRNVVVVANDTDVVVLLVHHFNPDRCDIHILCEVPCRKADNRQLIPIREVSNRLGYAVCNALPMLHAVTGCDTTSAVYGHGKRSTFKKLAKLKSLSRFSSIIGWRDASHQQVSVAGKELIVEMCGGKPNESLDVLRFKQYMNTCATSSRLPKPEKLPPTEDSAELHSYRIHLQTMTWNYLKTDEFNPEDWGWKLIAGRFVPIASNNAPAPDELLNVVRCQCKNESENQCGKPPCSCVMNGLNCAAACKHCSGVSCNNQCKAVIESSIEEADFLETCDDVEECDKLLESAESHKVTEDLLEFFIPWASELEV